MNTLPTRGVIEPKAKRKKRSKGLAQIYGQFLIDELKPYIDRKYRTKPECGIYRIRRILPGRSRYACDWEFCIRGLQSTHGDVAVNLVGRFRDLSTRRFIEKKPPFKIWLDTGTAEPGWEQARELVKRLVEKGWKLRKRSSIHGSSDGADHSEAAWAARVEPALQFLFPPAK